MSLDPLPIVTKWTSYATRVLIIADQEGHGMLVSRLL